MKILLLLSSATLFTACSNKSNKDKATAKDSLVQTTSTIPSNNMDTLTIDKNAAVFYSPDSAQMEKWKKTVGEKDFETVADDWSFYMNSTSEYLQTTTTPVENASDKKVLKFVKTDKSITLVRLDTLSNYWGVYLFTPAKEPKYADLTMMQDEYKSYFK
ncbi:MAG TPA: hypothetical protein VN451_10460 [Chitinophagaceae bacterium]|nr:hypothetical protein [Chitinophagaceae bacterium]